MKSRNFILTALMLTILTIPAHSTTRPPLIRMGQLTDLSSFESAKGANSYGDLLQGLDGNFYGTTQSGGKNGGGTLFKITADGTRTTLISFNKTNGAAPNGKLRYGIDGNMYGTTTSGGTSGGKGTVYKVTPAGVLTTLWSFSGKLDGANPYGGVVQGTDGNFYGTTAAGGKKGKGTVFQVTPNGLLTTIYSFSGPDGANPHGGVIMGDDGTFYGTTSGGGEYNKGTVFNIDSYGSFTTLWSFSGKKIPDTVDGENPYAGLIEGSDSNFYGTTVSGGDYNKGTVYQIDSGGSLTLMWSLSGTDGANPYSGVTEGSDGNFYGTTTAGGAYGKGTLFNITSDWNLLPLLSLNGKEGANPYTGLTPGDDGDLFGTTAHGGGSNAGAVFKLSFTSNVSAVNATVLGTVNPMGVPSSVYVEYGTDASYGDQTDDQSIGGGKNPVNVTTTLQGLDPLTTYHYHFVVSTDQDTFYSSDQTFNTGAFGLESVAKKGDPAEGIPDGIFTSTGIPAMNNYLGTAFLAAVTGTNAANPLIGGKSGIWADVLDATGSNRVRQLVVTSGSVAPGADVPGYSSALFSVLSDPVYNNNNAVAFQGTLKVGTGNVTSTSANSIGIWSNVGGTLHLVARQQDPAPGCANGEVFSSFSDFVLPDQGDVIFMGNLSGNSVTSSNNQGIWAVNMSGTLMLVVRKGDTLSVKVGNTFIDKTIKTLAFPASATMQAGQTRSYSQSVGDILYTATFTDGTWGIYRVALP